MSFLLQQGDVLIESIDSIPKKALKKEAGKKGFILAEGETTGHAHRISADTDVELFQTEIDKIISMYLDVKEPATITHEEHKHFVIPPGKYTIRQVREYDHFLEEANKVKD